MGSRKRSTPRQPAPWMRGQARRPSSRPAAVSPRKDRNAPPPAKRADAPAAAAREALPACRAFVVVDIKITDPILYEEYKRQASPTVAAYGGRYIVRGGPVHTVEGAWKPGRFVILEFPSMDRVRAWYHSDAYRQVRALRQAAAWSEMIFAEGHLPGSPEARGSVAK